MTTVPTVEKTVTETIDSEGRRTVVEEVTETIPGPGVVPPPVVLDPVVVERQLTMEPRIIEAPTEPAGEPLPPDARVYNLETNTVIVKGREHPFVTLPVLFEKETARLLDAESRATLDITAAAILNVLQASPSAVFDIEGHTSTDGDTDFNLKLSGDRAQRVLDELTTRYRVPGSALTAHGYGESFPNHPNGNESDMMLDRRVLVVRTQ
ncbi:OmpA family protein [Haloferula sargassicola]|uniref:OmpA family protein n=1 Tax=Haloferula sargassicola TaxID=490096 RepID=UPI0033656344